MARAYLVQCADLGEGSLPLGGRSPIGAAFFESLIQKD